MESEWQRQVSEDVRKHLITSICVIMRLSGSYHELLRISGENDKQKVWDSVAMFELTLWSNSGDRLKYMTKMHRKFLHLRRKAVLRPGGTAAPPQLQQQPQHVHQMSPLSEQTSTRLESAKLFSRARFSEALGELDSLQQQHPEQTVASELAARVLLWRAKCLRQGDQCDWNDIQKLLRRAFDNLAASDAVAEGLRHSIVLEMIVASVARQKLPTANMLSTEKVMEMCCCPISFEVMSDPVVTPSGVSYERAMIERHLEMVGKFDPMIHAKLTKAQLDPNRMLKQLVEMTLAAFDPTARGEACQVESD